MTKSKLFFLFILFSTFYAQGQILKYYHYENASDEFFAKGDTVNAIRYIDSALSYNLPVCNYYKGAYLHFLTGKYNMTFKYMKLAAENGLDCATFYGYIFNDIESGERPLDTLIMKARYPGFIRIIDSISKSKQVAYNLDYITTLYTLFATDQCIRSVYNKYNYEGDSVCVRPANEIGKIIDSSNFYELYSLYNKHGLPFTHLVGKMAGNYFLVVLGHNLDSEDLMIRKKANEILAEYKKGVLNGEFSNENYANWVDRMYHNLYKKNYYGRFYIKDLPFQDFENLDKMRAEIGLQPAKSKFKEIMNK